MFKRFSNNQSSGKDEPQDAQPAAKTAAFGFEAGGAPSNSKMDTLQVPKGKAQPKKRVAKAERKNRSSSRSRSNSQNQSDVTSMSGQPKRRGRKREKHDVYISNAQKKINEIKEKLKTAKANGMPVKERQKLRNMVSAQQSRIKKKEEVILLNSLIKDKDDKM